MLPGTVRELQLSRTVQTGAVESGRWPNSKAHVRDLETDSNNPATRATRLAGARPPSRRRRVRRTGPDRAIRRRAVYAPGSLTLATPEGTPLPARHPLLGPPSARVSSSQLSADQLRSRQDDDLADLLVGFHVTMRFDDVIQRESACNDRFELTRRETVVDKLLRLRHALGDAGYLE